MAFQSIGLKTLVLVAGLAFLSACETPVEKETKDSSGGTSTTSSTTTTTTSGGNTGKTVVPGSQEDLALNVGDRIFYDYDSSEIRGDQKAQVEAWAAWLKKHPSVTVTIEGHADERGTREYNLGLGDRRANSAKRMLEALGVSGNRVGVISFGKERTVCEATIEACWAQNRRGVMVVN